MNRDNRQMRFRPAPAGSRNYSPKPGKKGTVGGILFGIAVVILSFSFLILLFAGISSYRDSITPYSYYADEEDLVRNYTYKNYAKLVEDVMDDAGADREFTETELKLHAVAKYYEAASLVRAFEAAGNEERAAHYRKRMEELPDKMGEFADSAEKIDAIIFGE